jgi:hypothetical protein
VFIGAGVLEQIKISRVDGNIDCKT